MSKSMQSNADMAKADRKKVAQLKKPPQEKDMNYVILDKRFHARYYFKNYSVFRKRLDAFKTKFPQEFKKRFATESNKRKNKKGRG